MNRPDLAFDSPVNSRRSKYPRFQLAGDKIFRVVNGTPCDQGDGGWVPVSAPDTVVSPDERLAAALVADDPAALFAVCRDRDGRLLRAVSHQCRTLTTGSVRRIWSKTDPKTASVTLVHRDQFTETIRDAAKCAQPGLSIHFYTPW